MTVVWEGNVPSAISPGNTVNAVVGHSCSEIMWELQPPTPFLHLLYGLSTSEDICHRVKHIIVVQQ